MRKMLCTEKKTRHNSCLLFTFFTYKRRLAQQESPVALLVLHYQHEGKEIILTYHIVVIR